MLFKWFAVFLGFGVTNGIFLWILFGFLDRLEGGKLLAAPILSYLLFTALFLLMLMPVTYFGNILHFTFYRLGYQWFDNKVWPVQIIMWISGQFTFFFLTWFKKGELPSRGSIVALFFIMAGSLINILWK